MWKEPLVVASFGRHEVLIQPSVARVIFFANAESGRIKSDEQTRHYDRSHHPSPKIDRITIIVPVPLDLLAIVIQNET